jgi:hypothetical protein
MRDHQFVNERPEAFAPRLRSAIDRSVSVQYCTDQRAHDCSESGCDGYNISSSHFADAIRRASTGCPGGTHRRSGPCSNGRSNQRVSRAMAAAANAHDVFARDRLIAGILVQYDRGAGYGGKSS